MSDITAVVLTVGEETTQEAIASARGQSLPPAVIIVLENVQPFHKALNEAASRVRTEFFVQVDADMILDDCCFEALRRCTAPNVGLVVGHLRDPLLGRECCVKLFRRACFDQVRLRDTISADTDFVGEIGQRGWSIVHALRFDDRFEMQMWHTYGEHKPNYTTRYTFSKHLLEGRRYRYRNQPGGLRWYLGKLGRSNHGAALVAQIATGHGVFGRGEGDLQTPYAVSRGEEFGFLEGFLGAKGEYALEEAGVWVLSSGRPKEILRASYKLGIELRGHCAYQAFASCLTRLNQSQHPHAWIAKIGLCHGLFFDAYSRLQFERDYQLLRPLLPGESLRRALRAKSGRLVGLALDAVRVRFRRL